MQHIVDVFTKAYERLGLQLHIKETKVLLQPAPGAPEMADPVIRIHDDPLECVTSIPYLGSHLVSNTYIDSELQHRISAANCSFGKHRKFARGSTTCVIYQRKRSFLLTRLLSFLFFCTAQKPGPSIAATLLN